MTAPVTATAPATATAGLASVNRLTRRNHSEHVLQQYFRSCGRGNSAMMWPRRPFKTYGCGD
jgi:hypothetical protein